MGVKLAYEQWGRGPAPLLLLHGFTGSRESFAHLEPLLGHAVTAISVDLPGHGASPLPERQGREAFVETLDALSELVEQLRLTQVNLLGYSQGARVALGLALRRPQLFGRLILESGSPGLHRRQERTARRVSDAQWVSILRQKGVEAFAERWEQLPLFDSLKMLSADQARLLQRRRRAASAEGLSGALECLGLGVQPDYWPALHTQRVPTLLLTGALDTKFTELAQRMANELPVVWSRTFEGSGHAPHLEAPEAYAEEVLSFLATPWYEAPAFDDMNRETKP